MSDDGDETKKGFAPILEGKLFYRIQGRGPWLVLVHGAWTDSEWWRRAIPILSTFYKTLCFDLMGHGKSTRMDGVYSIKRFSDDLHQILSYFDITTPVLIGWSLGGMIAQQYCIDYPSGVSSLVLISTRSQKDSLMKLKLRLFYYAVHFGFLSFERVLQSQLRSMFGRDTPKEITEWAIDRILHTSMYDFFQIADSFVDFDLRAKTKNIKMPTLIMVGDKDRVVPKRFSDRMHKEISCSRLITFENCDHTLILDRPEEMCHHILKFLKNFAKNSSI